MRKDRIPYVQKNITNGRDARQQMTLSLLGAEGGISGENKFDWVPCFSRVHIHTGSGQLLSRVI